jgi:hypothetical protein
MGMVVFLLMGEELAPVAPLVLDTELPMVKRAEAATAMAEAVVRKEPNDG